MARIRLNLLLMRRTTDKTGKGATIIVGVSSVCANSSASHRLYAALLRRIDGFGIARPAVFNM